MVRHGTGSILSITNMNRFIALLLFIAQLGMVGLVAVHHHGPGDVHEDDCAVCQFLHAPARPAPLPPAIVLDMTVHRVDIIVPLLWDPQIQPLPASCRGPPRILDTAA